MIRFLTLFLVLIGFGWNNINLTEQQKKNLGSKATFQMMESIFSKAMKAKRAYIKNQEHFTRANDLLSNVCSTAPSNTIIVNADIDPLLIESESILGIDLFASPNNNASWVSNNDFSILGSPGYESTLEAGVSGLGATSNVSWYISALINAAGFGEGFETYGTIYASQSPQNSEGAFPPSNNYFANLIDEPAGDAPNAGQDIVSLGATYKNNGESLERVYFDLGLNGGCCAADGGFLGPWYLYGVGIVNPESEESIAYAIGYGDGGFGQLYPGVLKLYGDLSSGELGGYDYISTNISYQFVGNSLVATTLWNTIIQDSQWGSWPNSVNGFIALGVTVEAGLSGFDVATTVLDETSPGFFIPLTQSQQGNIAPVLSNPTYNEDSRTLSVSYSDLEGNLPVSPVVNIEGFGNRALATPNHNYVEGATFTASIDDGDALLADGAYSATFILTDVADSPDSATTLNFEFSVGSNPGCVIGDINGDTNLNVSDIVLLVSLILNGGSSDACSDINSDGNLNVSDIVLLVSLILNN